MSSKTTSFDLQPGRRLGSSYSVERLIGGGSEGEVYQIADRTTGIRRAAKLFYPEAKPRKTKPRTVAQSLTARRALKLEHLRSCPIVLQYLHSEEVVVRKQKTTALISELCAGEPLQTWIEKHRGKRVHPFVAMTILYRLVEGLAEIHAMGEYHSDVHTENILIEPTGIDFRLKLIDFYEWGRPSRAKMQQDVIGAVYVLADMLGGRSKYAGFPPEIKTICGGLRSDRILARFPTAEALRLHLRSFDPVTLY